MEHPEPTCLTCRDRGFVKVAAWNEIGRFAARHDYVVRVPCLCDAGDRWLAVRHAGLEAKEAPATWSDAVFAVVKDRGAATAERIARAMGVDDDVVKDAFIDLVSRGALRKPRRGG